MGGSVNAIEAGYIQDEIANAAYTFQTEIESGQRILVGVNKFIDKEELEPEVFRIDDSIRKLQIDKITKLKAERDNQLVQDSLLNLSRAAKDGSNTMPFILAAVEAYATLGEIANVFRKEFGEY